MYRFFLSIALFLPILLPAQRSSIDVLHYTFELELNDKNDSIKGIATIKYVFIKNDTSLTFDLSNRENNGKGMMVLKVLPVFSNYSTIVKHINNKFSIHPQYTFKKGDTATITIEYAGIPTDGLIISKNKYGNRTFFADNWPNRAHHWIPCVDDPADKATVEFIVTAPSHYQVIANGIQVEETNLPGNKKLTHYKEDIPLPAKVMVIGVAEFAVADAGMAKGNIPVSTWVFPEDKVGGFHDFAIAKDVLEWYIDYIGPFPYKKLANVQSKTRFGGMENAGAIFYHENSASGNREEEGLIAHEIVHQWFGDMATEKSFAHLWLSEGFASYLTHLYFESKNGTVSLNNKMAEDRANVLEFVSNKKRPVVDTTANLMSLLNANSYQKGSWVLHMLRRELGDALFQKSIRDYYRTYAGKNADSKDLQQVFENNSGKKLEQFFQQWLHTPENPRLSVLWKYNHKNKTIEIKITQQQQNVFQFPLELEITGSSGKKTIQRVQVRDKACKFQFPVKERISSVRVDPNVSLLFEGTVAEIN